MQTVINLLKVNGAHETSDGTVMKFNRTLGAQVVKGKMLQTYYWEFSYHSQSLCCEMPVIKQTKALLLFLFNLFCEQTDMNEREREKHLLPQIVFGEPSSAIKWTTPTQVL